MEENNTDGADDIEVIVVDFPEVDLLGLALDVDAPPYLFVDPQDTTMLKASSNDTSLIDRLGHGPCWAGTGQPLK